MDLLISLLLLMGLLLSVVIYQSRQEPMNIQMYVRRVFQLIMILYQYFKDVGIYMAQHLRTVNWELT